MPYTSLNSNGHKPMNHKKKKFVLATTVGSIVALVGIIMATSANFVFDLMLRTEMVLKPSSANFPFWSDLPIPIRTSMFVFNVTNAEEFSAGLDKPNLVEVGPYVFNEYHNSHHGGFNRCSDFEIYSEHGGRSNGGEGSR